MTMAPRAAGAGVRKPPREMLCRRRAKPSAPEATMESPMQQPHDLSRSLIPFCQESTLIGVVDMSQSGWLVAGIVPGVERHPLKKLDPDQEALLQLIQRWRDEAVKAGRTIARHQSFLRHCARRRKCPCQPIRLPSCAETWRACASSRTRSRRSRIGEF